MRGMRLMKGEKIGLGTYARKEEIMITVITLTIDLFIGLLSALF